MRTFIRPAAAQVGSVGLMPGPPEVRDACNAPQDRCRATVLEERPDVDQGYHDPFALFHLLTICNTVSISPYEFRFGYLPPIWSFSWKRSSTRLKSFNWMFVKSIPCKPTKSSVSDASGACHRACSGCVHMPSTDSRAVEKGWKAPY